MFRIFLVFILIFYSFQAIQAQTKNTKSQIDSLSRLFDAAKDDTTKIKLLLNAPKRTKEYIEKPAPILNLYYKALKLAERIGDKKSHFKLLVEIAYLEMYAVRDEPKAFQLFSQGLAYADQEKDYASCAQICFELAAINEHQNFRAEMYEYFLKAIAYNQKSPVLFIRPYRWASALYLEDNRIEDALKIAQQAVSYVEERSAPAKFKALAYGYYYAVLKKIPSKKQEAEAFRLKTINLLRQIKVFSDSDQLDDVATVCYEVEEYKLAIFFANQLLNSTDGYSQRDASKVVCLEITSAAYEKLGQHKKSLEFYKRYSKTYIDIIRSLLTLESGRKIIRAEGERNLLLKEKEIDQERFYRNLSFAIAAFILVLGAVVLYFYRREQARKAELQHLNATKDKLFAILSHDLRSPVSNLENNIMLTQWGALSQEEFVQSTHSLGQEISQVRNMLDNLLHWAMSQMKGMRPTKVRFDLAAVAEDQIKMLLPTSTAKSIQIQNNVPANTYLIADPNHLAVILRNLLQNALKFTHAGGHIDLKAHLLQNKVQIEVTDTGVGMSAEQLSHLFSLEKSSSRLGTSLEQGTGIGLVLVKELVEANQGFIQVSSEVNKGTSFMIAFRQG